MAADLRRIDEVEKAVDGDRRHRSTSAATRSRARGTRSCRPTSSAATICSRRRGARASSACLRLVQPRRRLLSAHAPRSAPTSRCGPTRATASARRSARRWARSMPTSTACACCACASATSATRRSTSAGCRSGSRPRTSCSCPHRPRAPRSALRDLLRRLLQRARWWDNSRAYDYGYRPTGSAEDHRERGAWPSRPSSAPDPVGDFFQGGTFCSAEFDGDEAASGNDIAGENREMSSPRKRGSSKAIGEMMEMSTSPASLLTHTPDMRRNYYGERALAGLARAGRGRPA